MSAKNIAGLRSTPPLPPPGSRARIEGAPPAIRGGAGRLSGGARVVTERVKARRLSVGGGDRTPGWRGACLECWKLC